MRPPKKILVAPLGWGLGHATRCVPIIQELQRQGAEVLLASDGRALALLRQEFPDLMNFELPNYQVQYRSRNMIMGIASQLPKIFSAIWREHWVLRKLAQTHGLDAVVSDNRYGCFSSGIPSIFLAHQLHIPVPKWLKWMVNFCNQHAINRFDECWVPDLASEPNLSGLLSHPMPKLLRNKVKYIGALTRMQPFPPRRPPPAALLRYDAIAVLSGPEPQRTELEKLIVEQASQRSINLLLVQGKPEKATTGTDFYPKNIKAVPSMTVEMLNQAMLESDVFIGRSGYSTVMDLAMLKKKALLVPTPGQPEQLYLAEKLAAENAFAAQQQHELDLETGIVEAKKRTGLSGDLFDGHALREAVSRLLQGVKS